MNDIISWADFEKVDLRVGTILNARDFPKAKKPAYQLEIDFGNEIGVLQSSAQITVHYNKEELIGKQVVAVVNFSKKQIANFFSECLVTGFPDENGDIILTSVDKKLPNGSKLS
ncbi:MULTISPECIES: tRNA-binding protein [Sphingobacterium]|jgi:tRNA-binding protein|uniref:tRNA-binding protein n=1 Tax=Sphingobacterium TaxID=28453 RepID=UPI0008A4B003|nr:MULTISPECIES: tRNA-binding protein [Sphingobacterium]OFV19443.1 tRNA-binding protein [Sphingobacterium sp. HMSC13C05]